MTEAYDIRRPRPSGVSLGMSSFKWRHLLLVFICPIWTGRNPKVLHPLRKLHVLKVVIGYLDPDIYACQQDHYMSFSTALAMIRAAISFKSLLTVDV